MKFFWKIIVVMKKEKAELSSGFSDLIVILGYFLQKSRYNYKK